MNITIDIILWFGSVLATSGLTATFAVWLSKKFIENRFMISLEREKSNLNAVLEQNKIYLQGEVQKKIDSELGDLSAERKYIFDAKQRLYEVVGPLRFQLLIYCRDFAGRVMDIGKYHSNEYLGKSIYYYYSTMYRFMMPFALLELIGRKLSLADFSIDKDAVVILRFKRAAYRAIKSDKPILSHPNENWNNEEQHLNHYTIELLVNEMMRYEDGVYRPMYFFEYEQYLKQNEDKSIVNKLQILLNGFNVQQKPVLWMRLVFYGYLCALIVNEVGVNIGFEKIDYNVKELLILSKDDYIINNVDSICANFFDIYNKGL